jgi:hypothetical protein
VPALRIRTVPRSTMIGAAGSVKIVSGAAVMTALAGGPSGAAPAQADVRLQLGRLYESVDLLPQAIAQYDQWIAVHDEDATLPEARNARCWARALLGRQLNQALADCNAALRARPESAAFLDS